VTAGQLPALVPLSERAWQAQVTQLAEMLGWDWAHWRAARTAHGWRTPVSGTLGEGFPDLLLVREVDRRMLLVELKSDAGQLTAPQRYVHACLRAAGLSVYTWRPRDWDAVVAALQASSEPSPVDMSGRNRPRLSPAAGTHRPAVARRMSVASTAGRFLPDHRKGHA
jgi:hypothetical protein